MLTRLQAPINHGLTPRQGHISELLSKSLRLLRRYYVTPLQPMLRDVKIRGALRTSERTLDLWYSGQVFNGPGYLAIDHVLGDVRLRIALNQLRAGRPGGGLLLLIIVPGALARPLRYGLLVLGLSHFSLIDIGC